MDGSAPNYKNYKILLALLRSVVGGDDAAKPATANTLAKKLDIEFPDDAPIDPFVEWLIQHDDFANNPERLEQLINAATHALADDHKFKVLINDYTKRQEQQGAKVERVAVLNDILGLRRDGDTQTANNLRDEYGFTENDIASYKAERHEKLIQLFEIADKIGVLAAKLEKLTSETARKKPLEELAQFEEQFSKIANDYGLIEFQEDGSQITTAEFNAEYALYCKDQEAYKAGEASASSAVNATDEGAPHDGAGTDDDLQSGGSKSPPQPPQQQFVKTFPVRDAEGDLAAFYPTTSYTEALTSYLSDHDGDAFSLAVDFSAEALTVNKRRIRVAQHADISGWDLQASERIALKATTPEAILEKTKIDGTHGSLEFGRARDVGIFLAKGHVKSLAEIANSSIALKEGDVSINDASSSTTYKLSKGELRIEGEMDGGSIYSIKGDVRIGRDVHDARITVLSGDLYIDQSLISSGVTLSEGNVNALGAIEGSKIELTSRGVLHAKAELHGSDVVLTGDATAEFSADITDSTITAATRTKVAEGKKASDTTFVKHIPIHGSLPPSDWQEECEQKRAPAIQKVLEEMPKLFIEAFGMGRPGEQNGKFSKLFWQGRGITLGKDQLSFMQTMFTTFDAGLQSEHFSIVSHDHNKNAGTILNALKACKAGSTSMVIVPFFTDREKDRVVEEDASEIKGSFRYRICIRDGSDPTRVLYDSDHNVFDSGSSNGGHGNDYWQRLGDHYIDIEVGSAEANNADVDLDKIRSIALDLEKPVEVFGNVHYCPLRTAYVESGKVKLPYEWYHNDARSISTEMRPDYSGTVSTFRSLADAAKMSFTALSRLDAGVYDACTFSDIQTNFYSHNMSGITLSSYAGIIFGSGDFSGAAFDQKTKATIQCTGDITLTGARVSADSELELTPEDASQTILVSANDLEIDESSLSLDFPSGIVDLKGLKARKATITIVADGDIDLSGATLDECQLTVKTSGKVLFNKASATSSKIKIESDGAEFEELRVGGNDNVIDLTIRKAKFTNAVIAGKTEIKGEAKNVDFSGAKIGDDVQSSHDQLSYGLKSSNSSFNNAEFGNVIFLKEARIVVKSTDWATVKITGNVAASGIIAKALYPLFGNAANLDHEQSPTPHAGNAAHPAREYYLN